MSQPNPFQLQPIEPVNVKDIFSKYSRNLGWFILSVMLCIAAAFIYLRYATTEYRVDSTILIKDDKKGADVSQIGDMFSDLEVFQSGKNIDDEIEVLNGKTLMQRVLRELNLQATYFKKGTIKNTEVFGRSIPVTILIGKLDSSAYDKKIVIKIKSATQYTFNDGSGTVVYQFGNQITKPYGTFNKPSWKLYSTLAAMVEI
ncbi:MAG: hypothetical protein EOP54_23155, partial [Sphingobacteriales bacterium]